MDAPMYRDILSTHMLPFARERLAQGWEFQQDNDPKHKSTLMMGSIRPLKWGWFSRNGVMLLKTPPFSPDLNPIEHLWHHVRTKLRGRRFGNGGESSAAIEEEWKKIPIDYLIKLVDSMPRRCERILKANGYASKY